MKYPRFAVRNLLLLTTCIVIGMVCWPFFIASISDYPPTAERLGKDTYDQVVATRRLCGGIVGTIVYFASQKPKHDP